MAKKCMRELIVVEVVVVLLIIPMVFVGQANA
jgi:ABC-type cobalt transport system substrate-binding protein